MASTCLTLAEFLSASGSEFSTLGANSTGTLTVALVGVAGDTITLGGVTLTAVAGARTPGSDDFSLASGTVAGIAQSIADAINDPLNSLTAILTAMYQTPGLAIVQLTSIATGVYTLLPTVTSAPANYTLSAATLEGGDELLNMTLIGACQQLESTCWGVKRSYGHFLLTSHYLALANDDGGGTVGSKGVGSISVSFAVTAPSDEELGTSKWGVQYLALRKTVVRFGAVSGTTLQPWLGIIT